MRLFRELGMRTGEASFRRAVSLVTVVFILAQGPADAAATPVVRTPTAKPPIKQMAIKPTRAKVATLRPRVVIIGPPVYDHAMSKTKPIEQAMAEKPPVARFSAPPTPQPPVPQSPVLSTPVWGMPVQQSSTNTDPVPQPVVRWTPVAHVLPKQTTIVGALMKQPLIGHTPVN
jgi:hypothetical protein